MEFDDSERRNIHDDLDQLLDSSSGPFEAVANDEFDSPSKKKVAFQEAGSGKKMSMNLDMAKLKEVGQGEGDEAGAPGESTTAKKKRKRNRKKNKNKQNNAELPEAEDLDGANGEVSGRKFDPSGLENGGNAAGKLGAELAAGRAQPSNTGYMSHRTGPQTSQKTRNYDLDHTPLKFKLGESFYEDTDSSEDEGMPDYKLGGYHCMHVGEVLVNRYVIIQKLGWGHFSTVWLAKDIKYSTYVALKIQRSASQYLEAAFDEVEILDQCSSYWMKTSWLDSLKGYYGHNPEKLKNITGNDCYCVQLLNCFLHHGPHGKHFVTVFEILGVNLLEVIKRYNYEGAPLPIVRQMARQCLIGLDYLHRECKVIHTDLKPENVSLCLTEQEVRQIATQGRLASTKTEAEAMVGAVPTSFIADQKPEQEGKAAASTSVRGRGNHQKQRQEGNDGKQEERSELEKKAKKALKRKQQRQRKKEKLKNQKQSAAPTGWNNPSQTPEKPSEPVEGQITTDSIKKKPQGKAKELTLAAQNESASKKKRPFDYSEKETSEKKDGNAESKAFSLKELDPEQMREINNLLMEYIEVPRPHSLPKKYVIPSPDMRPAALEDEDLTEMQRQQLEQQQLYFQQTGVYLPHRYEHDLQDVQEKKQQMDEFRFYRKKFEKSQRAKAANTGGVGTGKDPLGGKMGPLDLNKEMFDPQNMQQQIQEERAKKRGPKLDESLRLKICDLGNGCWTYHHFSTEIQTRQYRSPEVIIGAKYNTTADNWSLACLLFEMATGDFLFEPRNGNTKKYSQDDDHLAQMMELLGRMPESMALSGTKYRKLFDRSGQLKRIRGLNYWPLHKVLREKYRFKTDEAHAFADFLLPMLEWDPEKRASAQTMLKHPWLNMASNYDTRLTPEEHKAQSDAEKEQQELAKEQENIANDFKAAAQDDVRVEMSKLEVSDAEQHQADDELSTFSGSALFDDGGFSSSGFDDDLSFTKPSKAASKDQKDKKKVDKNKTLRKKDQNFIARDIAEGRTFNNSFTGPYPEDTDHLHIDKGANPQFDFLNQKV